MDNKGKGKDSREKKAMEGKDKDKESYMQKRKYDVNSAFKSESAKKGKATTDDRSETTLELALHPSNLFAPAPVDGSDDGPNLDPTLQVDQSDYGSDDGANPDPTPQDDIISRGNKAIAEGQEVIDDANRFGDRFGDRLGDLVLEAKDAGSKAIAAGQKVVDLASRGSVKAALKELNKAKMLVNKAKKVAYPLRKNVS